MPNRPHEKLIKNPQYKEFQKKKEKATIKEYLFRIHTVTGDFFLNNKSFWTVLFNIN